MSFPAVAPLIPPIASTSADPWAAPPPASSSVPDGSQPADPPAKPASVAQAYTRFLIHNAQSIASIESAVRSATYLLPGRFEGSEIASEGVFSLITLLHALHSHLLHAHLLALPPALRPKLPPPTAHDRYTRAWARHSTVYRLASGALVGVGGVQLLGEMVALKGGWRGAAGLAGSAGTGSSPRDKGRHDWERRWRWLVGVEGTKTILRLILLFITSRPLVTPPLPAPSLDPSLFASPTPGRSSPPSASDPAANPPPPPSASGRPKDPIREILLPKTLFAGALTPGRSLVRALSPRGLAGEVLHAVRGLVYVLMLKTRSTSLPVLLSLLVALASRHLLRTDQRPPAAGPKGKDRERPFARPPPPPQPLGSLEKDEFARRDRALGGLLFRGVIWDGLTKPTLEAVARKTQQIPLVGLVGGLLADYVPLIDSYYYYTES